MVLTRQEKEKLILDLYNQGKTYKQIAQIARVSPRDIKPVIEKAEKERDLLYLAIVDIKMPDMNGFELYRQIRSKDKQVKVCFLTAVSEFTEYEQYRKEVYPKLGERHFVAKPISNDELIKKDK